MLCSIGHQIYMIGYTSDRTHDKEDNHIRVLEEYTIDHFISSISLKLGPKNTEIVLGSENQKIYIYRNSLEELSEQISTQQGIRIVQHYSSKMQSKDTPDIIAVGTDHRVIAYKYADQAELWSFKAWSRIRTLTVKDIDDDQHDEVIIGSEDRNVHVLNNQGRLKWRYYLPYSVLCTHVTDINQDGSLEVLAGCADGYMYVFSKNGDLLWKYQVDERIIAITSRNYEHATKIALGTENRVELLEMIDPTYLQKSIERCWQGLIQGQSETQVVKRLLQTTTEPFLRAFALKQVAHLLISADDKFELFTQFVKDSSVEVRKALVIVLMDCYHLDPPTTHLLLEKLSKDPEREVRLTLVQHIDQLIEHDWVAGFDYLLRFSDNIDRFVRRAVMRKLYSLIHAQREEYWQPIFQLLLRGIHDQKSTWVRQEAARTFAHFLDHQPREFLRDIYFLISKDVNQHILRHMADHAALLPVRETLEALVALHEDNLNEENASDRLNRAIKALYHIQDTKFGQDTLLLYKELYTLYSLHTLGEIAQYQCHLKTHQPDPNNQHFFTARRVFESIPNVTRILKIYQQRQHVNDRISSLQDACRAIDRLHRFMDNEYQATILDTPSEKLPDYRFLELLFKRWREVMQSTLNDLRGKPEIRAELLTRRVYYERDVSLLLKIQNIGRSPAYSVRIALLYSEDFIVMPPSVSQTDVLFWHEILSAEFTIEFKTYKESISLDFEITYDDGEKEFCKYLITEHLTLQPMKASDYEFIPNPYSTGTPVNDNAMFFGREYDIELLKRELSLNTAQRIIVLHGLRRSGKTSLLRYLVKNDVLDSCLPIYIDMQNIIHEITNSRLFFRMAYHIQRTIMKKMQIQLALPEQATFHDDPTLTFDRFLDDVEATLQGQRIVLLIDEFEILQEQTEQGLLAPTLFSYLRSLMQERNMNFVLAGTHKLEQLTKDYWSVFYNFALPHRLSKLSSHGAQSLITQPVVNHLDYDPFAIDKIRQLAGDQPFLLHSLCRILIDHCNELRKSYVTLYDVNALLAHAVMINSIQFKSLWQLISPEEQMVLAAIAEGGRERPLSYNEIEEIYRAEHIHYDQPQLRDALTSLIQQDLLESIMEEGEPENVRYRLSIGLMRSWLNQEHLLSGFKRQANTSHK